MTASAFDRLLDEVKASQDLQTPPRGARLIRATHAARWVGSTLEGQTELLIAPGSEAATEIPLDPWTPAVIINPGSVSPFRSSASGRSSVRVEGGPVGGEPTTLTIPWRRRARPGSLGQRFSLGLGSAEANTLRLELPDGFEPEGPGGIRKGPEPGARPGFSVWTFLGRGSLLDLRIFRPEGQESTPDSPRLWCTSTTRIETGEASASWESDWEVSRSAASPRRFTIDLDPDLELLGVTGPAVEEVESFPAPEAPPPHVGATRVSVRLSPPDSSSDVDGAARPTTLRIRCLAKVPTMGRWSLPSAIPVNAVWTGGQTTVRLDSGRVLSGLIPRNGRRVPNRGLADPTDRLLTFESRMPGTVAELELKRPTATVSAEVRGRLHVGNGAPRLEGRLAWVIQSGRLHDVAFDLPPIWTADRVEVSGIDAPVTWHSEPGINGGTRIRVSSPTGGWSDRLVVLNVSATASVAGGRGPLALPRVRPVGARVADELWVAMSERSILLRPTLAKGLAWIDPDTIPPEPVNPIDVSRRTPSSTLEAGRPTLAWRWIAEDSEGRVERERALPTPEGSIHLVATLAADQLRIEGRIAIQVSEGDLDAITLGASESQSADGWHFFEEGSGRELPCRVLGDEDRAKAGIPVEGVAWRIDLSEVRSPSLNLVVRHEGRWPGQGRLPLPILPGSHPSGGVVLVRTGREVRTTLTSGGVRALDPEVTRRFLITRPGFQPALESDRDAESSSTRVTHAFSYDSPSDWAELRTESLAAAAGDGVIRDATLTSWVNPGAAT
ncbi:MAG: hypothetical protein AB7I30_00695, partial [Isosphaeraceae bacterium]